MLRAAWVGVAIVICAVAGTASAQTYNIGDTVNCQGTTGVIIRTEPRAGWDQPFFIVRVPAGAGVVYENKCLPAMMRPVAGATAPAAQPKAPAPAQAGQQPRAPAAAPAAGHTYKVGDTVRCQANTGVIVRTEPRPGWDQPFLIVRVEGGAGVVYENKCLPPMMSPVASAPAPAPAPAGTPAAAPQAPPPPVQASPAAAPAAAGEYRVGDSVNCAGTQGQIVGFEPRPGWDEPFMLVRTEIGPGVVFEQRRCLKNMIRPTAAAPEQAPAPQPRAPAQPPLPNQAPDGIYDCRNDDKHVGELVVQGGQGTLRGMPANWTVRGTSVRTRDEWGLVVGFDYVTPGGFNAGLDCRLKR